VTDNQRLGLAAAIAEIEKALSGATPKPWHTKGYGGVVARADKAWLFSAIRSLQDDINDQGPANAALIVALRNNVDVLLEAAKAYPRMVDGVGEVHLVQTPTTEQEWKQFLTLWGQVHSPEKGEANLELLRGRLKRAEKVAALAEAYCEDHANGIDNGDKLVEAVIEWKRFRTLGPDPSPPALEAPTPQPKG